MKQTWKETPMLSKIVMVCSTIVALAVMVLAALQIFEVWPAAGHVYLPLMGVNLLLQTYTQWKTNRGVAIFSLCVAVFIFACSAAVLLLQ